MRRTETTKRTSHNATFIYYNELPVSIFANNFAQNVYDTNRVYHGKSMKVTKRGVRVRGLCLIRDDEKKYMK